MLMFGRLGADDGPLFGGRLIHASEGLSHHAPKGTTPPLRPVR
jgi:hypothetical protein